MSIDATLETLMQELVEGYDSTISTAQGSAFYTAVMKPFLTRIGGSPLDTDLEAFLVERLQEEYPDLQVSNGSPLRDLVIRPMVTMLAPVLREISAVKLAQSLDNYDQLTREEVDAHLGNFFLSMNVGTKSEVNARLYFSAPQAVTVGPLTEFQTGGGLKFFPTQTQTISSVAMTFNKDGTLYYFDVALEAETAGTEYNIIAGDITRVIGLAGVVKVTNLIDATPGTAQETKAEAVTRAEESITIRNLETSRGINVVLSEAFPALSDLQVIGMGDAEMQRDIIYGPASLSSIPGGFVGATGIIAGGQQIHIGGKTDIYAFDGSLVEETLDIQNIEDLGYRVLEGSRGYTPSGPATTFSFYDDYAGFDLNGVVIGDLLRIGEDTHTIIAVNTDNVGVTPAIAGGLESQTYEIVRETEGFLEIPLYQLVAMSSSGDPLFDDNGDPVAPKPGSTEPLLDLTNADSNNYVASTENVAEDNIKLPVVRVKKVEFLNSLTLEVGAEIAMANVLLARSEGAFTGGAGGSPATGSVRLFFRDATSAYVTNSDTLFEGAFDYSPDDAHTAGTAVVAGAGNEITLEGVNLAGALLQGEVIEYNGGLYTVVSAADDGADTDVTTREAFSGAVTSTAYKIHQGISQERMASQTEHGLYYWDVAVTATANGAGGNIADGVDLTHGGVNSEGWSLQTTKSVLSYSTRETPYLRLSQWVGGASGATDLLDVGSDYVIRVTYDHAETLSAVQDFVDHDNNRVVAEDSLVRHFLPAYVLADFTVTATDIESALAAMKSFIEALSPTESLEVSDLIGTLYANGVTYVQLPISVVALEQAVDRSWHATISQDTLGFSRVQHFLPDEDALTLTAS